MTTEPNLDRRRLLWLVTLGTAIVVVGVVLSLGGELRHPGSGQRASGLAAVLIGVSFLGIIGFGVASMRAVQRARTLGSPAAREALARVPQAERRQLTRGIEQMRPHPRHLAAQRLLAERNIERVRWTPWTFLSALVLLAANALNSTSSTPRIMWLVACFGFLCFVVGAVLVRSRTRRFLAAFPPPEPAQRGRRRQS